MERYRITLTTVMQTDDLDLIKEDVEEMDFDAEVDVNKIINAGRRLIAETLSSDRSTWTFIKIESYEKGE